MIEVYLKIVYDYNHVYIGYNNLKRIYIDSEENNCDISIKSFDNVKEVLEHLSVDGNNEEVHQISKEEFIEQYNVIKEKIKL